MATRTTFYQVRLDGQVSRYITTKRAAIRWAAWLRGRFPASVVAVTDAGGISVEGG